MAFDGVKQKQSVMWGAGPFERIEATITPMHEETVRRLGVMPGERWLDVGCGTGGVAFLAAERGAVTTGLDLSPALIETARARAAERGPEVDLVVGDAESLPFEDDAFDVVSSTVGSMFAPDPEAVARELARVVRPGGRLGLANWRGESGAGDYFRLMAPFQPAPPAGGDPFDWGREERVLELLGDAFELSFDEIDVPYTPASGEEAWETFATAFGPLVTLSAALEPARLAELRREWVDYHEGFRDGDRIRQPRVYLFVQGIRRS